MDDAAFDKLALSIDPKITTGHPVLDEFFATQFKPDTGQWVRLHPELEKLAAAYRRVNK